jgi:hypothetical protein
MKTYILTFALAIFAIGVTVAATGISKQNVTSCCSSSECCKNCDDEECKTTCAAVSKLTDENAKTNEGKELIAKCKSLCEKNKCCKESTKCTTHNKKKCCKK